MTKSVYKFNFDQPNQLLENKIEDYGFDFDVYDSLKDCIGFEQEIDGNLQEILLVDSKQLEVIVSILETCEIKFIYQDITIDVLHSRVSFDDEEFQDQIDEFVKNNLTLDLILDKINLYGLKSLTDFEKSFLELF
jgi:hypothetical protein